MGAGGDHQANEGEAIALAATWTLQALAALRPDDVHVRLAIADTQAILGRHGDALATLAALRAGPDGRDPWIDLTEGQILFDRGLRRARAAFARAADAAAARSLPLVEAQALTSLAWTDANLGDLARADVEAERARHLFATGGNRWAVANVMNAISLIQAQRGQYRAAVATRARSRGSNGAAA